MSRKYPHIDDTGFPYVDNVDVYKYHNNFDYSRWTEKTQLKLCNVNWTSNYDNVVKFEDDTTRNQFFDNLESQSIHLDTIMVLQPQGNINLPIPFDVASRYNYLMVEFPMQTSPSQPIEYENSNGRRIFFYFIKSVNQLAASNTQFMLQLDVWTTFINSCEINYMMLERGHAPMAEVSVDEYLENPLENNKYLLAQDVVLNNDYVTPYYDMEVLNSSDTYVCFAVVASFSGNWGTKHQTGWQIPDTACINTQGVPNNIEVKAIKREDYESFMQQIFDNCPQLYRTIRAIFLVNKKYISLGSSSQFLGKTIYNLDVTQKTIKNIKLSKSMFNFDDKYKEIAKLYTFPYSFLELSDGSGQTHQIRIENTNNDIDAISSLNIAFPFLNMEMMFTGIGNNSTKTASFKNLDTKTFIYSGQWKDYLLKYEIPTYAVTSNNANEFDVDNYWDLYYLRELAGSNYQNSMDMNDVEYNNSIRTNNANLANGRNLGTLQANEGNANANNCTAIAGINTSTNDLLNETHSLLIDQNTKWKNDLMEGLKDINNDLTKTTYNTHREVKETQGWSATGGQVVAGALEGGVAGATLGGIGALPGAAIGALVGLATAAPTLIQTYASMGAYQEIGEAQITAADKSYKTTKENNLSTSNVTQNLNWQKTQETNDGITGSANLNANNFRTIGGYRNSTYSTNASNTQIAENTNATNLKAVKDNNAYRTYIAALTGLDFRENQGKLENVSQYGNYKNGDSQAFKPMNLHISVNTKPDSEISQIGDFFLRYGYALNQNWNFEDFNIMRYFTYWKVGEVWINTKDKMMNENDRNTIRNILYNGTTIWSDATKIGKVSIYDN